MITYTNIQRHDNLEFGEYIKLQGYSHSFLKSEVNGITPLFKETDKVLLGKFVDAILTESGKVDMLHPLYTPARSIAHEIKKVFGDYIKAFQTQISYTANLNYEGFSMPSTGRLDFLLPTQAVIDLKVTAAKDVRVLIEHMGYKNQLWHYCNFAQVKRQYIMIYSVPLKRTFLIDLGVIEKRNIFWESKILKFGTVSE